MRASFIDCRSCGGRFDPHRPTRLGKFVEYLRLKQQFKP